MKRFTVTLMLMALALQTTLADEIIVRIPAGTEYIKITGDNLRVTRATVVDLDTTPTDPTDPVDPPVEKLGLIQFSATEAKKINDPATQAAIGQIYAQLAAAIRDGKIKDPQNAATAAKTAVDLFLSATGKTAKWAPFTKSLKAKLDSLAQTGKITTIKDVGQAYEEIAQGMKGTEAINPALLALIIQIIKIVLELIANK